MYLKKLGKLIMLTVIMGLILLIYTGCKSGVTVGVGTVVEVGGESGPKWLFIFICSEIPASSSYCNCVNNSSDYGNRTA